jgi:hypothetical protein
MRDRSGFIPTNLLHVPCPAGLHRATYERLIREYNRVILAWLGRKEPERDSDPCLPSVTRFYNSISQSAMLTQHRGPRIQIRLGF